MYTSLRYHLKSEAKILPYKAPESTGRASNSSTGKNDRRAGRGISRIPVYSKLASRAHGINSLKPTSSRIPRLYRPDRLSGTTESAVYYGGARNLREELEEAECSHRSRKMPSISEDEFIEEDDDTIIQEIEEEEFEVEEEFEFNENKSGVAIAPAKYTESVDAGVKNINKSIQITPITEETLTDENNAEKSQTPSEMSEGVNVKTLQAAVKEGVIDEGGEEKKLKMPSKANRTVISKNLNSLNSFTVSFSLNLYLALVFRLSSARISEYEQFHSENMQ